jgi:hypothetical protein
MGSSASLRESHDSDRGRWSEELSTREDQGAMMARAAQLVKGVDFVSRSTQTLDRSMDFYGNTLGL